MLVILDQATLEPREILEAEYAKVCERLGRPGKAHERGALGVGEFRRVAKAVWPPVAGQDGAGAVREPASATSSDPRSP